MTTWEYKVLNVTFERDDAIQSSCNELGSQGWELVSHSESKYAFMLIFKKAILQPES